MELLNTKQDNAQKVLNFLSLGMLPELPRTTWLSNDVRYTYNMRFDDVTKHVVDCDYQIGDSILRKGSCWSNGIEENFIKTALFQVCHKVVNYADIEIGNDDVFLHIALRNFSLPANRTELRAFVALAQQVIYATMVAPRLLPF